MTTSDYMHYTQVGGELQSINSLTGEVQPVEKGATVGGFPAPAGGGLAGGLSTAHICTWLGGGLVQASATKTITAQKGGGKRGKITLFSRASRRRLMQTIAKTKKSALPVFITLTYPGEWSKDAKRWKRDLRVFWMRLERRFPHISAVWKLEFQKRGAPHYHLLVWGAEYAPLLLQVGRLWYEVVGSGDERHLLAGTRVEKVRDWRGVMSYASKYLGKLEVSTSEVGRFWGVMNSEFIPWADLVTCSLTDKEAYNFIRLLRRFMGIRSRAYKSLTAFADGTFWFDRIDRIRGVL